MPWTVLGTFAHHSCTHRTNPGSVYRDASLQLPFTSSLTVSLQSSGFFLIGALISNEFSLFFIEIPKQLWHILFVLLKTGKWRSVREIKTQLTIYWGMFSPRAVPPLQHISQHFSLLFRVWRSACLHEETPTPRAAPALPRSVPGVNQGWLSVLCLGKASVDVQRCSPSAGAQIQSVTVSRGLRSSLLRVCSKSRDVSGSWQIPIVFCQRDG